MATITTSLHEPHTVEETKLIYNTLGAEEFHYFVDDYDWIAKDTGVIVPTFRGDETDYFKMKCYSLLNNEFHTFEEKKKFFEGAFCELFNSKPFVIVVRHMGYCTKIRFFNALPPSMQKQFLKYHNDFSLPKIETLYRYKHCIHQELMLNIYACMDHFHSFMKSKIEIAKTKKLLGYYHVGDYDRKKEGFGTKSPFRERIKADSDMMNYIVEAMCLLKWMFLQKEPFLPFRDKTPEGLRYDHQFLCETLYPSNFNLCSGCLLFYYNLYFITPEFLHEEERLRPVTYYKTSYEMYCKKHRAKEVMEMLERYTEEKKKRIADAIAKKAEEKKSNNKNDTD